MIDNELYHLLYEYETLNERNGITIGQFLTYIENDHGELVVQAFKDFYQAVTGNKIPVENQ